MIKQHFTKALAATALAITSFANAAPVELVESFKITMSRYGQVSRTENFVVAVDNVAADKQVFIRRQTTEGTWVDIPMHFAGNAGSNKEYWKVSNNQGTWGDEFAVRMTAQGGEYWDSNYGYNYRLSAGYTIGKDRKVAVSGLAITDVYLSDTQQRLGATLVLDNVGMNKQVELIYSFDNWASSTAVPATYNGAVVMYGYGSYANPNAQNMESWSVKFDFPKGQKGQFYVKYTVDGVSYYDTNYGANYTINYNSTYPTMRLQTGPYWNSPMPMELIGNNLWSGALWVQAGGVNEMKFDVFNNWNVNYGDTNADGIADRNGANIATPAAPGSYRVFFNDQTKAYWVQPYGL